MKIPIRWNITSLLVLHFCNLVCAQPPPTPELSILPKYFQTVSQDAHELAKKLITMDNILVRKQNLHAIKDLCDQLLMQTDPLQISTRAELLYRKGRAIGYRELPDVRAKFPVADPKLLDIEFNDTFDRLNRIVDTTDPQYVLLRIRRERRNHNLHEALRLIELYRLSLPSEKWYQKKRQDTLFELGLYPDRYAPEEASVSP